MVPDWVAKYKAAIALTFLLLILLVAVRNKLRRALAKHLRCMADLIDAPRYEVRPPLDGTPEMFITGGGQCVHSSIGCTYVVQATARGTEHKAVRFCTKCWSKDPLAPRATKAE